MKKQIRSQWVLGFWLCAVLLYFIANMQKVIMPGTIFNELQRHYDSSAASITAVGAVFMYTYAISQLVVGLLVDRYSGARVMVLGGLFLCGGGLLSSMAPTLWILYIARVLVAFGAASIYLSITKETSRLFPGNFAIMLGFVMVGGYLGGVTGNTPFIIGVGEIGWQKMVMAIGSISLFVYLGYMALKTMIPSPQVVDSAKLDFRRFLDVLSYRQNIHIIICGAFPFGLYFAIQSIFGKKFLEDYVGMTAEGAGLVLTILMVIGAVNSIIAPSVSKWMGNRRKPLMIFSGIGSAISFALIVSMLLFEYQSCWLLIGAFALLAFAGNISPVIVVLVRESNKSDIWGVMLSVYTFLAYIVTAVIGNATGWILDKFDSRIVEGTHIYGRESYLAVYLILFLVSFFAVYSGLRLKETAGKNLFDGKD